MLKELKKLLPDLPPIPVVLPDLAELKALVEGSTQKEKA